ncbi:hypothetical protein KM043_008219 [Ampulex compressa]|nr:hypothetical protein KM043_008219 [Ampulex compressa]
MYHHQRGTIARKSVVTAFIPFESNVGCRNRRASHYLSRMPAVHARRERIRRKRRTIPNASFSAQQAYLPEPP